VNVSDKELIEQIQKGNARIYAQLVKRHKDRAFTLALRLVGDRHDAEELVQDAFVRAYRSLDSFRGDAKFSTWFYRIVYNLCMTRISRRRTQSDRLDLHDDVWNDSLTDADEYSFDEKIENDELMSCIKEEIERLPIQYRSVITLFYAQEMSYEEICEILQLPVGTVKTNLFRGRNALRELVFSRLKGELV
jgi:RNA polymerase sigma-70 factor, ECF subfamily